MLLKLYGSILPGSSGREEKREDGTFHAALLIEHMKSISMLVTGFQDLQMNLIVGCNHDFEASSCSAGADNKGSAPANRIAARSET
jgi:hypothetical protein